MDQELLQQIEKLPGARGKEKAVRFAKVLVDDLKHLEQQVGVQREEARKLKLTARRFQRVKALVEEQATLLKSTEQRNDAIEIEILALLGIKGRVSDDE